MTGRITPRINGKQTIAYALCLIWAYLTGLFVLETMMAAPALLNIFIGLWWTVFIYFYVILTQDSKALFGRAAAAICINLIAGIHLCIALGVLSDVYLSLGQYYERHASVSKALRYYELGLKKKPKKQAASYLQYRAALLKHKIGEREKAENGFHPVTTKYTVNEQLVKQSNHFLYNDHDQKVTTKHENCNGRAGFRPRHSPPKAEEIRGGDGTPPYRSFHTKSNPRPGSLRPEEGQV